MGARIWRWRPWIEIGEGESVPHGFGVASDWGRRRTMLCVVMPLNILVGAVVRLYWWLSFPGFALRGGDMRRVGQRSGWLDAIEEMETFVFSWASVKDPRSLADRVALKANEMRRTGPPAKIDRWRF